MPATRPRPILARSALAMLAGVAALTAAGATSLPAQLPGGGDLPHILVTGIGEVSVAPDRATIDVAVETRSATASAAAAQNARRLRSVMDTLKARGIPAADISTVGYSVHPDYEPSPRGEAPRRGYMATNVIRVETRSLDAVGSLLDAVLSAGANRVNEVRFSSSRHAAVRDSAMTLAIAQARRTADGMARAAGGRLGALLELSTEMGPYTMREAMMRAGRGVAGSSVANQTSISPDQLSVGAAVVARWRFEPGR